MTLTSGQTLALGVQILFEEEDTSYCASQFDNVLAEYETVLTNKDFGASIPGAFTFTPADC